MTAILNPKMSQAHDMTFAQRLARLDLTAVMQHVKADTGLADEDLARAEDLYRKYLTLIATYPGQSFVPPKLVDAVWHAHITFTRQYFADCDLLFGEYLHHTPELANAEDLFPATVAAYQSDFGVNLYAYGVQLEDLMSAARCGN